MRTTDVARDCSQPHKLRQSGASLPPYLRDCDRRAPSGRVRNWRKEDPRRRGGTQFWTTETFYAALPRLVRRFSDLGKRLNRSGDR